MSQELSTEGSKNKKKKKDKNSMNCDHIQPWLNKLQK
jgi:hypothetical protein